MWIQVLWIVNNGPVLFVFVTWVPTSHFIEGRWPRGHVTLSVAVCDRSGVIRLPKQLAGLLFPVCFCDLDIDGPCTMFL